MVIWGGPGGLWDKAACKTTVGDPRSDLINISQDPQTNKTAFLPQFSGLIYFPHPAEAVTAQSSSFVRSRELQGTGPSLVLSQFINFMNYNLLLCTSRSLVLINRISSANARVRGSLGRRFVVLGLRHVCAGQTHKRSCTRRVEPPSGSLCLRLILPSLATTVCGP